MYALHLPSRHLWLAALAALVLALVFVAAGDVLSQLDFNGRVLSIRRDDLRAICALLQVDSTQAIAQLEAWGALVASPAAFD